MEVGGKIRRILWEMAENDVKWCFYGFLTDYVNYWSEFKIVWINVNFDDVYEQCDVGNVVNVWFKGETRENGQLTDHVQVAHDQKIWINEKFEQKIDFGEK